MEKGANVDDTPRETGLWKNTMYVVRSQLWEAGLAADGVVAVLQARHVPSRGNY
ncbi:hypothetical protein MVI01_01090 [Myxococcus virescens]|uniref:Uncharacterized protein n=1 Tax=Myxococcus virescens TaxID=83456 RepID=A0A511H469_9BACT|nr:hypothetical protein MVI01_01090 [Myxococcus virescens]